MLEHLLKPTDVATTLGVSRSFAYQLIKSGDLPSVRIGRTVRVRPQDLETFIQFNVAGKKLNDLAINKPSIYS